MAHLLVNRESLHTVLRRVGGPYHRARNRAEPNCRNGLRCNQSTCRSRSRRKAADERAIAEPEWIEGTVAPRARRAAPRAFYKLRDDTIVPVICPTCQNVFAG